MGKGESKVKRCARCGNLVEAGLLTCPTCEGSVFETDKVRQETGLRKDVPDPAGPLLPEVIGKQSEVTTERTGDSGALRIPDFERKVPDFRPIAKLAQPISWKLPEPVTAKLPEYRYRVPVAAKPPEYGYRVMAPTPGPQTISPSAWFAPKPRRNGRARRWSNGYSLMPPRDRPGFGSLRVVNGTDRDAVVKLVAITEGGSSGTGNLCRFVYVCAGRTVTILGIGAGTYALFFCVGAHWDKTRKSFGKPAAAVKFVNPVAFTEEQTASGVRYVRSEVTLHPVPGGRAVTTRVDQQSFDALQ